MKRAPEAQQAVVLLGGAAAVRSALRGVLPSPGAVVVIGAARDIPGDVAARFANWSKLELKSVAGGAETLILAEPPPTREAARAVLASAAEAGLKVALIDHGAPRAMTIGDFIGRALARLDREAMRSAVVGKRVLITGGGGSIGGELARKVASLGAAHLTLLDCSEFNLCQIARDVPKATIALADIRDLEAMRRWFAREKPDLVFHAGALKQVPLVEAHPSEGVRTNVGGCRNVADAALSVGANMVFLSTDKAVNPSGVMGASKRLAELYCQALDRESARKGGPRFITVRLGNVLGSAGSVSPLFESQLAAGGPLTVTDPHVTRFFITIPQAAECLLQAAAAGASARATRGAAYVLDMGEPLPVVDLARIMIQLSGRRPDDVGIVYVGMRPGEKLHEELVAADEIREPDPAPGVMAASSPPRGLAELNETIERLTFLWRRGADEEVAALLHAAVAPGAAAPYDRRAAAGA